MAEKVKDIKKVSEVKPIDLDTLRAKVGRYKELQSDMAEVRGRMGSFVKTTETDLGIHRGAFTLISRLEKMSEEKFADWRRTFEPWWNDRIKRTHNQGDMLSDVQSDNDVQAKKAPAAASNIVPLHGDDDQSPPPVTH